MMMHSYNPAFWRWNQEDQKFKVIKASLGYVKPCTNKQKTNKQIPQTPRMVTNNPVTDTRITKDFFPQLLSRTSMGLLNFERQVTALLAIHCYEVIYFKLCFFQRLLLVNSSSMGTARMASCPEILSDGTQLHGTQAALSSQGRV